jgi:hypothetical protein
MKRMDNTKVKNDRVVEASEDEERIGCAVHTVPLSKCVRVNSMGGTFSNTSNRYTGSNDCDIRFLL